VINKKIDFVNEAPPIPARDKETGRKIIIDNQVATRAEREEYWNKVELREKQLDSLQEAP